MSKDISSMYTKDENKKNGRRGWVGWKNENIRFISPANYGCYISKQKKRGKKKWVYNMIYI